jgi:cytochrome c biogenesis protein CcmG/thiol:disulfide interchange protein DsbE
VTEEEPPRSSRRGWVVGGAVAAVFAVAVVGLALAQRGGEKETELAPPIELRRLGGEDTVSLASFRGRPVVVNFFASWCVPCRKELPAIQTVASKLGDRVAFLGVDHQDNERAALELVAETGVRFPSGYDPDGKVATSYGLFGMPTTLFVDAQGRLLDKHTGELTQAQLEASINRLFGI